MFLLPRPHRVKDNLAPNPRRSRKTRSCTWPETTASHCLTHTVGQLSITPPSPSAHPASWHGMFLWKRYTLVPANISCTRKSTGPSTHSTIDKRLDRERKYSNYWPFDHRTAVSGPAQVPWIKKKKKREKKKERKTSENESFYDTHTTRLSLGQGCKVWPPSLPVSTRRQVLAVEVKYRICSKSTHRQPAMYIFLVELSPAVTLLWLPDSGKNTSSKHANRAGKLFLWILTANLNSYRRLQLAKPWKQYKKNTIKHEHIQITICIYQAHYKLKYITSSNKDSIKCSHFSAGSLQPMFAHGMFGVCTNFWASIFSAFIV